METRDAFYNLPVIMVDIDNYLYRNGACDLKAAAFLKKCAEHYHITLYSNRTPAEMPALRAWLVGHNVRCDTLLCALVSLEEYENYFKAYVQAEAIDDIIFITKKMKHLGQWAFQGTAGIPIA